MKTSREILITRLNDIEFPALSLGVLFFCCLAVLNLRPLAEQQYVDLSSSFLKGQLDFPAPPAGKWDDTSFFEGKHFWSLAPFPSLLLAPLVWLFSLCGQRFFQGYLSLFLSTAVFILVRRLAARLGYRTNDSLYLALAFVGSAFMGVAFLSWSWYFAHVVAVLFLWLALTEWAGKKRCFLIGVCLACALASRPVTVFASIYFLLEIIFSSAQRERIKRCVQLLCPIAFSIAMLMLYNFARFHTVWESGYRYQLLPEALALRRALGIISWHHWGTNIYYAFFALPELVSGDSAIPAFPFIRVNPWGLSLLVTSPCLLALLALPLKNKSVRHALLTSLITAAVLFSFFGIGYRQIGYRFSLDFLPFLFLALFLAYRAKHQELSRGIKWLIALPFLANLWLTITAIY